MLKRMLVILIISLTIAFLIDSGDQVVTTDDVVVVIDVFEDETSNELGPFRYDSGRLAEFFTDEHIEGDKFSNYRQNNEPSPTIEVISPPKGKFNPMYLDNTPAQVATTDDNRMQIETKGRVLRLTSAIRNASMGLVGEYNPVLIGSYTLANDSLIVWHCSYGESHVSYLAKHGGERRCALEDSPTYKWTCRGGVKHETLKGAVDWCDHISMGTD